MLVTVKQCDLEYSVNNTRVQDDRENLSELDIVTVMDQVEEKLENIVSVLRCVDGGQHRGLTKPVHRLRKSIQNTVR